jgi:4-amino-4-deoxy-L-arabinose transferase-like glycosyltransferase
MTREYPALRIDRNRWIWLSLPIAMAAALFLPQLGGTRLFDQDEGYYASVAMEMHQRNDWILPTFNHALFAHKPPMMFWGMRFGYQLFGLNEVGARIGSVLAGILTVVIVARIGNKLFDPLVGFFAGLALASNLMFSMVSRSATADAYLTLCITASLGAWAIAYRGKDPKADALNRLQSIPFHIWLQSYAWMALAVLAKGPIGILFPATIIGLSVYWDLVYDARRQQANESSYLWRNWLLCAAYPLRPNRVIIAIRGAKPLLGLACIAAIAGPWYVLAELQSSGRFLQEFIGIHHLGRFSQAMDNHEGPFFYYAIACIVGMYPWSAFAIPIGIAWIRAIRSGRRPETRWVTAWMFVYLVVFSIASTKLPNYVLPAYPAFALCTGYYMREVLRMPEQWSRWQTVAWYCLILVGGLVSLGTFSAGWVGRSGSDWVKELRVSQLVWDLLRELWWLGLPLIGIGVGGAIFQCSRYAKWLPLSFALTSAAFLSLLWHVAAPKLYSLQAPQRLAQEAKWILGDLPRTVRMMDLFRPSVLFYSERPVEFTGTRAFLQGRFKAGQSVRQDAEMLLLRSSEWELLQRELPGEFRVLVSVPHFPEEDELFAVGNAALLSEEK